MFEYYHPSLVWLALGALAPVIIHFAARNKPKRTPFPALRFILASHRKTATKFKLKQLLLLLLRMAALALFAFVIARPLIEGETGDIRRTQVTVTAVIVFDTSYSMLYEHGGSSSFEKAKEMALAAIGSFAPGKSRVCLLFAGPAPKPVITDFNHAFDLDAVKKHIREAEPSYRGGDCARAVAEAVKMLDKVSGAGKAVFVFTDMTAQSWPRAVPAGEKTGNIAIYIADSGPARPLNPALLGVSAPVTASTGAELEVKAKAGAVGTAGRRVELTIDGERRGLRLLSAHQVEEISLTTTVTRRSTEHWGRVAVTGKDHLPVDNRRYFTFRSSPPLKVVLVNGAPSEVARRDELTFLRTALAPRGVAAGQSFEVAEMTAAGLGAAELAGIDVLALCNVGAVPQKVWTNIRRFVSTGSGLIVFGGDNVVPAAYEAAATGETPLLPCVIGMARTLEGGTRLEPGRLAHPILHRWRGGRNGDLAGARFKTYLRLTPNKKGEVVLAFKNGDPALVIGKYGTGLALVYASSCDRDWNTFPRTVPYPVLMHELLKHLVASRQESRDVLVGLAPALTIQKPKAVRSVTLSRLPVDPLPLMKGVEAPDDKPEDVTGRLEPRSGELSLSAVERPGLYRVAVARDNEAEPDEHLFAVNLDTEESHIERLEENEDVIKSLLPEREVKIAKNKDELLDHISSAKSQSELASDLAGIVLAVLLAEMYLSNHMRARVATTETAA
ncbi:MAG: BatA domain-containing protein [Planctomycetota bacterium]